MRKLLLSDVTLRCDCGAQAPASPRCLTVTEGSNAGPQASSHGRDSTGQLWRVSEVVAPAGWRVGENLIADCPKCVLDPRRERSQQDTVEQRPVRRGLPPRSHASSTPAEMQPELPRQRVVQPRQARSSSMYAPSDSRPKHVHLGVAVSKVDRYVQGDKPSTATRTAMPEAPVPRDVRRPNPRLSPTTPRPRDSRPQQAKTLAPPSSAPRAREVSPTVAAPRSTSGGLVSTPVASVVAATPTVIAVAQNSNRVVSAKPLSSSPSTVVETVQAGAAQVARPVSAPRTGFVAVKAYASAPTETVRPVATGSRPNAPLEIVRAEAQPTRLLDVGPKVSAANVAEPPKPRPLVESWTSAPVETAIIQKR